MPRSSSWTRRRHLPRRRSDTELRQRFEPQKDLENGGKTSEKGGNRQVPPFFCKDQRRQSERQEDEHEGSAGACHLHPIPHGICVSEEKDDEKDEEGGFESGREQNAQAKLPVSGPIGVALL